MTLDKLFFTLWSRRLQLLAIVFLCCTIGLLLSKIQADRYSSTSSLIIDIHSPETLFGSVLQPQTVALHIASQQALIESPTVTKQVVNTASLFENAMFIKELGKESTLELTNDTNIDWIKLSRKMSKLLTIHASTEKPIINITVTTGNPDLSALLANAYAEAYIAESIGLKVSSAKTDAVWLKKDLNEYKKALEDAQSELSFFQLKNQIVTTDSLLDTDLHLLSELQTELVAFQSNSFDSKSRFSLTDDDKQILPEITKDPSILTLKRKVAENESIMLDLKERLRPNHPDYISANKRLNASKNLLSSEINRIAKSISTADKVNIQKELFLTAKIDAQKSRILKLQSAKNKLDILEQEVENAQSAYDVVHKKMIQSQLESRIQQTNLSVLYGATPSSEPTNPSALLNMAIFGFLGALIAAGILITLETFAGKVRSESELQALTRSPLLVNFK